MSTPHVPSPTEAADGFLAAVLRGSTALPSLEGAARDMLPERALHHGVAALIATSSDAMDRLTKAGRSAIDSEALGEAMWDLRHRHEIVPLLAALDKAGIAAVLLKGTALAYSLYGSPAHRQRGDSDILVAPENADAARRILQDKGFARSVDPTLGPGEETNRQENWIKNAADGTHHAIDLHWGVMRAWSLATLFETSEVLRRAVPLPKLSPVAKRVCNVDAVYHACLHRGVHIKSPYYVGEEEITGGDRLVWLYDIHLLIPELSEQDWDEIITRSAHDKTADLCLDALEGCETWLGSSVPGRVLETLRQGIVSDGPSFLLIRASEGKRFWSNLVAIPGLPGKLNFLRILLFPSPLYMRQRYPQMARQPVAFLYLRRVIDRLSRRPS